MLTFLMALMTSYPIITPMFHVEHFVEHSVEQLSDAQIATVSQITHHIQIEGAKLVYPQARYFEVQNFSKTMENDNVGYQNVMGNLMVKYGMEQTPSQTGADVQARGEKALAELSQLSGKALEKAYVNYQVELHEKTLESIREVFLPNVQNVELGNIIHNIQPTIQNRLDWARRIQASYVDASR